MGERTFFFDAIDRHGNGTADAGVNVDDEDLFVIAEEDGTAIGGGHQAFDGNFDDISGHREKVGSAKKCASGGRGWLD